MRCFLAVLLLGCGAMPSKAPPSPPGPPGPDGNVRLGTEVVPLHYDVDLTIDPTTERVSGVTRVIVRLEAPTTELKLHAEGLEIQAADAVVGDSDR